MNNFKSKNIKNDLKKTKFLTRKENNEVKLPVILKRFGRKIPSLLERHAINSEFEKFNLEIKILLRKVFYK